MYVALLFCRRERACLIPMSVRAAIPACIRAVGVVLQCV